MVYVECNREGFYPSDSLGLATRKCFARGDSEGEKVSRQSLKEMMQQKSKASNKNFEAKHKKMKWKGRGRELEGERGK